VHVVRGARRVVFGMGPDQSNPLQAKTNKKRLTPAMPQILRESEDSESCVPCNE